MVNRPINRKAIIMQIPTADPEHDTADDCPCCVKDKNHRASGYFVQKIQERTCKHCNGTTKSKNPKTHKIEYCRHCLDGVFPLRSELIKCKACKGTGKQQKKEEMTSMAYAFNQAKNKALLLHKAL